MSGASPPATAPTATSEGPQRYGRYILIDRLGAGGMAEVFRALVIGPEQFQRIVVVKRILPHLSADPNFVRMFISEATICGRLNHPNIIHVHEFGKVEDHYFIAMEYVQGRTLNSILARLASRNEFMRPTIAADIARQTCLALGYAHALTSVEGQPLGVVHRDVTPSNVMVAYAGGVKVLDFGIARVAGELRAGDTDAGKVKGKSSYLAPEQIEVGAAVDGRADIFSTGIILHEALCCRRLFRGAGPVETMKKIRQMPIPPPSSVNPDVPRALDEIVLKALERDPGRRWQSAEDMADALEAFLVERRYASQELPKWLRGLFTHQTTEVELALPQAELAALMQGLPPLSRPITAPRLTPNSTTMVWSDDEETPSVKAPSEDDESPTIVSPPSAEVVAARREAEGEPVRTPRQATRSAVVAWSSPRVWAPLALLGLAVLAAIVSLAVWRGSDDPARESPATPAPAGPTGADPLGAPQRAAPSRQEGLEGAPAAPEPLGAVADTLSSAISISSRPSGAEVRSAGGGAALGRTPLVIRLPRGRRPVAFQVIRPGYVPGRLEVVPDEDKKTSITLTRAAGGTRRGPPTRGDVRNAIPVDPFAL